MTTQKGCSRLRTQRHADRRALQNWLNPGSAGISAGGSRFAHAAKTPQFATHGPNPLDPYDPLEP